MINAELVGLNFLDFFRKDNLPGPKHENKFDFFLLSFTSCKSITVDVTTWSPLASARFAPSVKTAGHSSLMETPSGSRDSNGTLLVFTSSRSFSASPSQSDSRYSSSSVGSSDSLCKERDEKMSRKFYIAFHKSCGQMNICPVFDCGPTYKYSFFFCFFLFWKLIFSFLILNFFSSF